MRNVMKVLAVAAVVTACGCIDATTLVKVNKDGSGQIVETIYMSAQMSAMMAMGAAQGGQPPSLLDEAKLKSAASKFGSAVTFESAKEVSRKDGSKGVKAVYAFPDVTQLRIDPASGMQGMQIGELTTEGHAAPLTEKEGVSFGFKKGPAPTLTVNMPQDDDKGGGEEADVDAAALGDDAPAGMEGMDAMMKQMFEGMRMRFYVMVDGEIQKSDATYVEANKATGKKQMVALMDINFGELIKDPEKFKKLQTMGPGGDAEAMKLALKDMPGIKAETKEKIEITFK